MTTTHPALNEFRDTIGARYVVTDTEDKARFESDWAGTERNAALAVLRPASTEEVSGLVKICATHGLCIVPQTGNTGLAFGSTPTPDAGTQVVINLERMDQILSLDAANNSMVVEAGCILERIQNAADDADRFFALDLNARGSCRIGGNISTNAGGLNVLAYGNCRDQVLGLEVVLADGRIWNGLRALRKDNSGYDLKQMFIGAEGTLGIVTKAVLRLHPKPKHRLTMLAAVPSPDAALELLARFKSLQLLTSFELMIGDCVTKGAALVDGVIDPLAEQHPWYILSEHSLFDPEPGAAEEQLLTLLEQALEDALIIDATLAQNETQAQTLWDIREGTTPLQKALGASIKHEVSVPVSQVPELIRRGLDALHRVVPGCRPLPFGHMGDGNLHFNVNQPETMSDANFKAMTDAVNRAMHDEVLALDGSISAEHGIGRLRKSELARTKNPVALEMMRAVKSALDPDALMNPGKVF